MAPPRRRSATRNPSSSQSTLSFGSKARISKPSSSSHVTGKKGKEADKISEIRKDIQSPIHSPSATYGSPTSETTLSEKDLEQTVVASSRSENLVQEQARAEIKQAKSEEDQKAEALSEEDLRRYWIGEEESRIAPRGSSHITDLHFSMPTQVILATIVYLWPVRLHCINAVAVYLFSSSRGFERQRENITTF